jgi:thioredoxin reductase (NADPH)
MIMKNFDLIIFGAGPGGLTAAIYALRAGLSTLLVEKNVAGGRANEAADIENYPGFGSIAGYELMQKFLSHANALGAEILYSSPSAVKLGEKIKSVSLDGKTVSARSVIIATGSGAKKLNLKGEDELLGGGISYCASCDGAFFKNKRVMVYGGGKTARGDVNYLLPIAGKLYAADRGDLEKINVPAAVEKIPFCEVIALNGRPLKSVTVLLKDGSIRDISLDGLFVAAGYSPNTLFVSGEVALDETAHIITDENLKTNLDGVYAAGDVRAGAHKQIVSACSDGARAAEQVIKYLRGLGSGQSSP